MRSLVIEQAPLGIERSYHVEAQQNIHPALLWQCCSTPKNRKYHTLGKLQIRGGIFASPAHKFPQQGVYCHFSLVTP